MYQPLRNWRALKSIPGTGRRLVVLLCGLLPAALLPGSRLRAQDEGPGERNLDLTFVGTSFEARSALEEVRRALAHEDWSAAASLIQVAIEKHGGVLQPLDDGGFSTTRSICHEMLLSRPDLLAEYRLRADHAVKILLERARDAGRGSMARLEALRSVPDRFLASSRGPEIAEDVADGLFERGEIGEACEIWERIVHERLASREIALRAALKLAFVARARDDLPALIRLRRWAQRGGLVQGDDHRLLASAPSTPFRGPAREPGRLAGAGGEDPARCLLELLSAADAPDPRESAGELPLRPSTREDLVSPIARWKLEREEPLHSGRHRRWFSEPSQSYADLQLFFAGDDPMVTLPRKVLSLKWGGAIQPVVDNGEAPASSRNPCRYFAVVDRERGILFVTYLSRRDAAGREPLGALLCFSLEQSAELWSSEKPRDRKLLDFDVLGNPVFDRDNVYVIANRVDAAGNPGGGEDSGGSIVHQGELHLLAIGREDGLLRWRRFVASEDYSGYQVARGREVRVDIPLLAIRPNLIIAGTNLGAVVAVEPSAGRIRWVHRYPKEFASTSPWRSPRTRNRPADPPLFHGDLVVVCPSDSNRMAALDIADGRPRWTVAGENFQHLLPAPGGRILASGPGEAACFSARDGSEAWRAVVPAAGRGVIAGDSVYFATEEGLAELGLSDGAAKDTIPWKPDSVPGVIDLYRHGNRLYGVNREHVTLFGGEHEF